MKIYMMQKKDATPKQRLGGALKMISVLQLLIGLACAVTCFAAIGVDRNNLDQMLADNKTVEAYAILGLDSASVVSSVWVISSGFVPLCMMCGSDFNLIRTKVFLMVFSIMSASLFVPIMMGAAAGSYILRGSNVALPVALGVLSLVEFLLAIVAAAYCCTSPWAPCKLEKKANEEKKDRYIKKAKQELKAKKEKENGTPPENCP